MKYHGKKEKSDKNKEINNVLSQPVGSNRIPERVWFNLSFQATENKISTPKKKSA